MAQTPVYNPPIPYIGLIPGGLQPGKMITIDGFIPHHSQRFAINIQCGPGVNPRDDMNFHINMRFPEACVVRNHLQNMSWGAEECVGGMPLTAGSTFQAIILCELNCYKLALNGAHFCEFPHRIPYQRASHMTIDGDVTISLIQFQGGSSTYQQPSTWTPNPQMGPQPGMPVMGAPPPYGPPPPYSEQNAFSPAAFSYAPPPQAGYQQFPQPGGYAPQYGYQQPPMPPYNNFGSALNSPIPPSTGITQHKSKTSIGTKALMYGLPLAGVGLGAYALGGGFNSSSDDSS